VGFKIVGNNCHCLIKNKILLKIPHEGSFVTSMLKNNLQLHYTPLVKTQAAAVGTYGSKK
jgi:ribonuclease D